MNRRRSVLHGVATVRYRRQRRELHLDLLGRVFRDIAAVGDDHGDRIAHIADLVARQDEGRDVLPQLPARQAGKLPHRLPERRALGREMRREVRQRVDRVHTGQRARGRGIDPAHDGMSEGTAHEGA